MKKIFLAVVAVCAFVSADITFTATEEKNEQATITSSVNEPALYGFIGGLAGVTFLIKGIVTVLLLGEPDTKGTIIIGLTVGTIAGVTGSIASYTLSKVYNKIKEIRKDREEKIN